ncbi:MAG TPA: TonB-dependent receptor [Terriglobales bacterium]|nr:TonB-dependent receptor [Terriglobales bacterium]
MKKYIRLLFLPALLIASSAFAQVTTGQINGTLVDPSGAVVTGATVSATEVETGFTRSTQTNSTGNYGLVALPPGHYNLKTEAKGFATLEQKNIEIIVGQALTLNFTLRTGTSTEVVEVSGEAPLIETSRSDIGGSVSPQEVRDLPVRDRNFASLMALVPGVKPAPNFDPTKSRSGTVSAGGSDGRAFDYNVDGGDNKDTVIGGIVQNYTLEGIQEFNVVTNRYTAESGRAVAGVVNVVTKSGTNKLHGTAFGEFQLSTFNAKSEFDRTAGPDGKLFTPDDVELSKPVYHRYHFGGSVGGPIIKDKFFFFGAYEYKRELAAINPDPTAVANLELLPQASPATKIDTPFFDQLATIKLDYRFNERHSIFARYGRERWNTLNDQPTTAGTPIADLSEATANTNQFHSMVLQDSYALSNNKVNVAAFQFQDFVNEINATPGRTFTLPVAGGGTAVNPLLTFPSAELGNNINVPQQTLIRKYQFRDDFSWVKGRHNLKVGANWIYIAKMGGYFFSGLGYQLIFFDDPTTIFGAKAADYPQGLSTPGAVQELIYSAGNGRTDNPQNPHALGLYFQDDFKVTSHLTLNLGLRWDANLFVLPPQLRTDPLQTNRVVTILRQLIAANPTSPAAAEGLARAKYLAGSTDDLTRTTASYKEFQPRIGFAWDPTGAGKIVIRGGYGIARDQVFQNLTLWSIQQSNTTLYQSGLIDLSNSSGPPSPAGDLATFRYGIDPLPAPAAAATDLAFGARGRLDDPKLTDPWSQQMSIGSAIELNPEYALSVDYTHVLGTHEFRMLDDNPRIGSICNPAFGGSTSDPRCVNGAGTRLLDAAFAAAGIGAGRLADLRTAASNNRSLYDGINFVFKKRMSHNIGFQASYVLSWSRSWGGIPVSSYGGSYLTSDRAFQFRSNNWGPTDFDERHRFVISGIFMPKWGIELAPLFQASSARPIDFYPGVDIDGDGRPYVDRVCVGSNPNNAPITSAPGCTQVKPNSLRGDAFVQMDLSIAKRFHPTDWLAIRPFWEFHNLFNRFNKCNSVANDASQPNFLQPLSGPISGPYCALNGGVYGTGGGSFGPGFSAPFRSQFGIRFEF